MHTRNWLRRFVAWGGVVIAIFFSGPPQAQAQGADHQTPVQFHLCNSCGSNYEAYDVNPTQQLTVEFLSGQCIVPNGSPLPNMSGGTVVLSTTVSGSALTHFFFPVFLYTDESPGPLNGARVFGFTTPTRLYADPGSRVQIATGPSGASGFVCVVRGVGYTAPTKQAK